MVGSVLFADGVVLCTNLTTFDMMRALFLLKPLVVTDPEGGEE